MTELSTVARYFTRYRYPDWLRAHSLVVGAVATRLAQAHASAGRPVDVVMGNKITRHDPLHRRFISWAYHHSMRLVFGFQVHDVDCDFRLLKRRVFDVIVLTQNSGAIALELMTKVQRAGYDVGGERYTMHAASHA